jgi:hypothetical protein
MGKSWADMKGGEVLMVDRVRGAHRADSANAPESQAASRRWMRGAGGGHGCEAEVRQP